MNVTKHKNNQSYIDENEVLKSKFKEIPSLMKYSIKQEKRVQLKGQPT